MNQNIELRPITPDMADDWREHIVSCIDKTFAIGFTALATKVYDRLGEDGARLRGTVANAVLAMVAEGELSLTDQGNIQAAAAQQIAA